MIYQKEEIKLGDDGNTAFATVGKINTLLTVSAAFRYEDIACIFMNSFFLSKYLDGQVEDFSTINTERVIRDICQSEKTLFEFIQDNHVTTHSVNSCISNFDVEETLKYLKEDYAILNDSQKNQIDRIYRDSVKHFSTYGSKFVYNKS